MPSKMLYKTQEQMTSRISDFIKVMQANAQGRHGAVCGAVQSVGRDADGSRDRRNAGRDVLGSAGTVDGREAADDGRADGDAGEARCGGVLGGVIRQWTN